MRPGIVRWRSTTDDGQTRWPTANETEAGQEAWSSSAVPPQDTGSYNSEHFGSEHGAGSHDRSAQHHDAIAHSSSGGGTVSQEHAGQIEPDFKDQDQDQDQDVISLGGPDDLDTIADVLKRDDGSTADDDHRD